MRMFILLILLLFTPLLGIIFGVCVANQNNIPFSSFSSNIMAVMLGIPLALMLGTWLQIPLHRHLTIVSLLALCIMVMTFLSFSIAGIHRWISIGSMYLNISMIFTPLFLYIINVSLGDNKFLLPMILTISISTIHVLQPDAGQATTFGCATIIIFILTNNIPLEIRFMGIISIAVGSFWLGISQIRYSLFHT